MENRFGLLVTSLWVLATLSSSGEANFNVIRELIAEEARKELDAFLSDTIKDIHEVLIGDKYHRSHDFRVDLFPNQHQCYYQEADDETFIAVNFECLDPPTFRSKGGLTATAFMAENGQNQLVSIDGKRTGEFEIEAEKEGVYAICFGNKHGSSSLKVQIVIDIWRGQEVGKFHAERIGTNNTVYETFGLLFSVLRSVAVVRSAITHTTTQLRYDYLTRISSLSRINNFSVLSVVLIVTVCFLQLRIVKKMFGARDIIV